MKRLITWALCAIVMFSSSISHVNAAEPDLRAVKMHAVLEQYHSPMVGLEDELIATAEQYNLDWTLLAAIAGTESSFAIHMPANCINPYGWGIYGANKLCFDSLQAAVKGVAEGLHDKYDTSSLEAIAHTYNHVSTAGWLSHTKFFMRKIKTAQVPVSALPITL